MGRTTLSRQTHQRLHLALRNAAPMANSIPEPASVVVVPAPVELAARSASTGCADNGAGCETTSGNSPTLPIAIGVAIPVVCALVVLIYLHRRHVRKLRAEDANDTHRSLDFGFEPNMQNKKRKRGGKGQPDMTEVSELEKSVRHPKGLSLDMDLGNPYMLPPEMQQSHESLHSLSRALGNSGHDPYRPTTLNDAPSIHGSQRVGDDNASTRTGGTGSTGRGFRQDGMNHNLLRNASRVSQSHPPESSSIIELPDPGSTPAKFAASSLAINRKELPQSPIATEFLAPAELDANPRQSTASRDVNLVRQSNNYLANFIQSREPSLIAHSAHASLHSPSPVASQPPERGTSQLSERVASPPAWEETPPVYEPSPPRALSPLRAQSPLQVLPGHKPLPEINIEQEFPGSTGLQYTEIVVPPPPDAVSRTPRVPQQPYAMYHEVPGELPDDYYDPDEEVDDSTHNYLAAPGNDYADHRLSIMRPLPPEDPNDTAEQRANRIRSFYKEYFHDNEAHAYAPQAAYYEDYGSEYVGDQPTIFDPNTGQFVVAEAPFAAPVTRRAMTPPPRGPPRFQGRPQMGSYASNPAFMPPPPPRSRAFSTVSAGMGPRGPRPRGPVRQPPPPKDLRNLPTPHLLKDDNVAIFGAMDFAPPPRYKDQQAGRPSSPFLDARPYSPSVPVASPLASSFTELNAMPSPHHLRKSGTFTALDFAPPPRFRDRDNMSDAGSIRSGRSNNSAMSAVQMHNLRSGAYRLSRIPRELVGSRQEFANSLKPTWHVGST